MYLKYSDDIKLHSMSDLCTVNYVVTSARAVNLAEFKLYPIIHIYIQLQTGTAHKLWFSKVTL